MSAHALSQEDPSAAPPKPPANNRRNLGRVLAGIGLVGTVIILVVMAQPGNKPLNIGGVRVSLGLFLALAIILFLIGAAMLLAATPRGSGRRQRSNPHLDRVRKHMYTLKSLQITDVAAFTLVPDKRLNTELAADTIVDAIRRRRGHACLLLTADPLGTGALIEHRVELAHVFREEAGEASRSGVYFPAAKLNAQNELHDLGPTAVVVGSHEELVELPVWKGVDEIPDVRFAIPRRSIA